MFLKPPTLFHMGTNARVPGVVSKAVSEELRVIRARLPGESLRELADRCGVPYSTLHKSLAGDRMVDVEELHRIGEALHTTASAVLLEVEKRLGRNDLAAQRSKRRAPAVAKKAARKDRDPDA